MQPTANSIAFMRLAAPEVVCAADGGRWAPLGLQRCLCLVLKMKTTKLASIAIIVLLSSSALGSAQRSSTAAYQTNLHERLKLFVEYQRNERWDKVAELLGDCYFVGGRRAKYSQSQKTQMIEDLKARPMLELDLVRTNVAVGSDNISLPMNRQYRWVYAFIRFCDGPNCIHIQSRLVGYMNNRKWFFTPSDVEFYRRDSIGPSPNAVGPERRLRVLHHHRPGAA